MILCRKTLSICQAIFQDLNLINPFLCEISTVWNFATAPKNGKRQRALWPAGLRLISVNSSWPGDPKIPEWEGFFHAFSLLWVISPAQASPSRTEPLLVKPLPSFSQSVPFCSCTAGEQHSALAHVPEPHSHCLFLSASTSTYHLSLKRLHTSQVGGANFDLCWAPSWETGKDSKLGLQIILCNKQTPVGNQLW